MIRAGVGVVLLVLAGGAVVTRSDQTLGDEVAHCHPGCAGGLCAGCGAASPCRSGFSGNLPQDAGPVRCHFRCQRRDPVRRELRTLPRPPSQGQWRSGQDLREATGGSAHGTAHRPSIPQEIFSTG